MRRFGRWAKTNLLTIVLAAAVIGFLADAGVFAFQLDQYGQIQTTQAAQARQQARIKANAVKNTCWSHVLDEAIATSPLSPSARAALLVNAHRCAKIP